MSWDAVSGTLCCSPLTTSVISLTISASGTEKRSPARDKSRLASTFVNSSCISSWLVARYLTNNNVHGAAAKDERESA